MVNIRYCHTLTRISWFWYLIYMLWSVEECGKSMSTYFQELHKNQKTTLVLFQYISKPTIIYYLFKVCVKSETVSLERTLKPENNGLFFLLVTSIMLRLFDIEIIQLLYYYQRTGIRLCMNRSYFSHGYIFLLLKIMTKIEKTFHP